MKRLYCFLLLFSLGCSTAYQFTYYKPAENEPRWRITVEKTGIENKFICLINDLPVVVATFDFFDDNFEKDGTYHGRAIKMSGYSRSYSAIGPTGDSISNTMYHIRVFVDETEAATFSF